MICNPPFYSIDEHFVSVLAKFVPRMHRNLPCHAYGQNSDTAVGLGDLDFLYGRDISAIVGSLPCDLDLWPFDLEHVSRVALYTGIVFAK